LEALEDRITPTPVPADVLTFTDPFNPTGAPGNSQLIQVNALRGEVTTLYQGQSESIAGLAVAPKGDVYFSQFSSLSDWGLYKLDPTTRAVTPISSIGNANFLQDIAVAPNGSILGIHPGYVDSPDTIWQIEPTTGAAQQIYAGTVSLLFPGLPGIAPVYAKEQLSDIQVGLDGKYYFRDDLPGASSQKLARYDPKTGNVQTFPFEISPYSGYALAPDGGILVNSPSGSIVRLDPTTMVSTTVFEGPLFAAQIRVTGSGDIIVFGDYAGTGGLFEIYHTQQGAGASPQRIWDPPGWVPDFLVADPLLVTSTADSGIGSLREAILHANDHPGTDTIGFAIPPGGTHFYYRDDGVAGQVSAADIVATTAADDAEIPNLDPDHPHSWWSIQLASPLPPITGPVTIDGTTQPGYQRTPLIELDGSKVAGDGLTLQGGNSTVVGLEIDHFQSGSGIVLKNDDNTIGKVDDTRGSTKADGNSIHDNGKSGVTVLSGTGNSIRGNLIWANKGLPIDLGGSGQVLENTLPSAPHNGPNNLQSFPGLSVVGNVVDLTLISTPNTTFRFDFYLVGSQGAFYKGHKEGTTDDTGTFFFPIQGLPVPQPGTDAYLTATATDKDDNTSEMLYVVGQVGVLATPAQSDQVDLAELTDAMQGALGRFEALEQLTYGEVFPITSAFRSTDDQAHLYELKTKYQQLAGLGIPTQVIDGRPQLEDLAGTSLSKYHDLVVQVNQGILDHTLLPSKTDGSPAVYKPSTSAHEHRVAVDISVPKDDPTIDVLAALAGLSRPIPTDYVHFQLAGTPAPFALQFVIHSPVALLITDPLGRHLGFDPSTGTEANDIDPLATDSGAGTEPRVLTIPLGSVVPGLYQVSGVGTGSGPYSIELQVFDEDDPATPLFDQVIVTGTASPGETIGPIAPIDPEALATQPPQSTTTTLVTSDHPSGSVYGQTVTFSAAVSAAITTGGPPTGSVQFDIDGTPVGSPVPLVNGSATLTTATLSAGPHAITAFYTSDSSTFSNSDNSATPFSSTVAPAPLIVTADDQSKVYGQANPALTAHYSGFVNADTAAVLSGIPALATTAGLYSAPAAYAITVGQGTLAGPNYAFVFVNGTLTVNQASTGTTLTVSAATPLAGVDPVTLTATVAIVTPGSGALTGTVDFYDTTTDKDLGSAALVNGVASLTAAPLVAGNHALLATYSGDSNFLTSSGPASLTALVPASLSGLVFEDFNADGQVDFGEAGIAAVTITLTGTDDLGHAVSRTRQTDSDGIYLFANLRPGNYYLTETQPAGYGQGTDSVGTAGGSLVATDQLFVQLGAGVNGLNYNYGERPPAGAPVHQGQTAGIGFWNNKNGQALIKALNGGPGSTQLADWLAATFPHLYGAQAGSHNLAGQSNAQVAAFFQSLFVLQGPKVDAQVLAAALAVYVTNATLDSTGVGASYGFTVQGDGVGTATFNVGANGDAFGVANNSVVSVMNLLLASDAQAVNGVLYNGDSHKRDEANAVFSALNQAGGIS
jgi:hypothetical protein